MVEGKNALLIDGPALVEREGWWWVGISSGEGGVMVGGHLELAGDQL